MENVDRRTHEPKQPTNMNAPTDTTGYMLLFRGPEWDQGMSPEEFENAMTKVMAWFDGLQQKGLVKGGDPLAGHGRTISGSKAGLVTDGPFAETKEAIGGYLMLNVGSLEEAVEIGKSNPTLAWGITIEVRPVLAECPVFKRAREQMALATA